MIWDEPVRGTVPGRSFTALSGADRVRAWRSARGIRDAIRHLGLELRAGVHTGECEVSQDDVAGIAVHVAARVLSAAGPGEVLVSSTVKDLVAGSGLRFSDRGRHQLMGIEGERALHAVAD